MEFKQPKRRGKNPETLVTDAIRKKMKQEGWLVVKLHGNQFQSGLPDCVAFHPMYGTRWIEIKQGNNVLSNTQIAMFSQMAKHGAMIYLMRSPDDYYKLFKPANWWWGTRTLINEKIDKLPKGMKKVPPKGKIK